MVQVSVMVCLSIYYSSNGLGVLFEYILLDLPIHLFLVFQGQKTNLS